MILTHWLMFIIVCFESPPAITSASSPNGHSTRKQIELSSLLTPENHHKSSRWRLQDKTMQTSWQHAMNKRDIGTGFCPDHAVIVDIAGTVISSPGYPHDYPNLLYCQWKLVAPHGTVIHLIFDHFDVEFEDSCHYDSLSMYEGPSWGMLNAFCGVSGDVQAPPNDVIYDSSEILLVFSTDISETSSGFQVTVEFEEESSSSSVSLGCDEHLTTGSGELASPGFYNNQDYPNFAECQWNIQVLAGNRIKLTFLAFNLENSFQCSFDLVDVYDGLESDSRLARLCGNLQMPRDITSSGNRMTVIFSTDSSVTSSGFHARYVTESLTTTTTTATTTTTPLPTTTPTTPAPVVECGGVHISDRGTISSPNFNTGGEYTNNLICEWRIAVTTGVVKLDFNYFDLETCDGCGCDRLAIYNSWTSNSPIHTYCGGQPPPAEFISNGPQVKIMLITDFSVTATGFEIGFSRFMECGGDTHADSGTIESPYFGQGRHYPHHSDCDWTIQVSAGNVRLHFTAFALELCSSCVCDKVQIFNSTESSSALHTLCGSNVPSDITVPGQRVYIKFLSDFSVSRAGFQIQWSIDPNSVVIYPPACGGNLQGSSGIISSPNFGTGVNYPNDVECEWFLQVHHGMSFRMHFMTFSIQYCYVCGCDKLEIYNDFSSVYPVTRVCGNGLPSDINLQTPTQVKIRFATNSFGRSAGFEAGWNLWLEATTPVPTTPTPPPVLCGGFINDLSGAIRSPDFDINENYPDYSICEWIISAEEGKVIVLEFSAFAVQESLGCRCDYVEIFTEENSAEPAVVHCGFTLPSPLVSPGPFLLIKFVSDNIVTARGFEALFVVVDASGGPPEPVPPTVPPITNATCGQQDIQPRFLRVVGGQEAAENSWPWQISLRKPVPRSGSEILWGHACGGSIIGDRWILTAAHCVDDVQDISKLQVVVGDHHLPLVSPLEENYQVAEIHLHGGYTMGSIVHDIALLKLDRVITLRREVEVVCLAENPIPDEFLCVLTGWGNTNGTGDRNYLQQVRLLTIPQATCQQPSWHGSSVTDNMLCAGYPEGGRGPCFGDSGGPLVCKIHETWRQYGIVSWGGRVCAGPQNPGVFTRVSRYLGWISHIVEGREIPAVGQNECTSLYEPVVKRDAQGRITSPGFILNQGYVDNQRCSWRIVAGDAQIITLTFEELEVESHQSCAYDVISVYDGPNMEAPSLGRFCGNSIPGDITGTTSSMYITFQSDGSVTRRGFQLSYRVEFPVPVIPSPPSTVLCGRPEVNPRSPRIVGGLPARAHSWPWQVSLQRLWGSHFCGGSIAGPRWIITAAHCVKDETPGSVEVVIREHNLASPEGTEKTMSLDAIIVHEDYDGGLVLNDIALLRLTEDIVYDNDAMPICVPQAEAQEGQACTISGWGETEGTGNSDILNQVEVPILNTARCNQTDWYNGTLTDTMMCAGYADGFKDSCQGDSGGPLMCRVGGVWYLHGITSWGYGCADPFSPGIYTRVSMYADWIEFYTNGEVQPVY